jgi:phage tail-like protein
VRACTEDFTITPRDVDVMLLNDEHEPLLTWHLVKAYPTRWSASDLNASSNAIVVETLQLFYQYFTLDRG